MRYSCGCCCSGQVEIDLSSQPLPFHATNMALQPPEAGGEEKIGVEGSITFSLSAEELEDPQKLVDRHEKWLLDCSRRICRSC